MEIRIAEISDVDILIENDPHIKKEELLILLKLNRVLIAEKQCRLIGWLRYNLFWDSIPFMNMLYFVDEEQKKGYGRQMVNHWENKMRELGYVRVMTSTVSGEYAQHFYVKLGYQTIGGFLLPGEPYEIILTKSLK